MMPKFYYEDFEPGQTRTSDPRTVTREEIVSFASEFDPQPMHLDEAAARNSMLGGLAASGWHTCALMFRITFDEFVKDTASMGSPGIEEVRWLKPVRPGMKLTLRRTVLDKRTSKSRPEMGLVRMKSELVAEDGKPVIEQTNIVLIRVRNPGAAK
jgi:acyl dehydratase